MDKIIEDDELGRLVIRVNSRARSLVFRTKSDAVYVSSSSRYHPERSETGHREFAWKTLASRQKNRSSVD